MFCLNRRQVPRKEKWRCPQAATSTRRTAAATAALNITCHKSVVIAVQAVVQIPATIMVSITKAKESEGERMESEHREWRVSIANGAL